MFFNLAWINPGFTKFRTKSDFHPSETLFFPGQIFPSRIRRGLFTFFFHHYLTVLWSSKATWHNLYHFQITCFNLYWKLKEITNSGPKKLHSDVQADADFKFELSVGREKNPSWRTLNYVILSTNFNQHECYFQYRSLSLTYCLSTFQFRVFAYDTIYNTFTKFTGPEYEQCSTMVI